MQLKFKKTCLLTTVFVYCTSFLLQSNFVLFQALAKEDRTPRVNIVAILVDNEIYGWSREFRDWLKWYASNYVQQQLSDTKALVIPLNLKNIHAYDIYRMMENIYFDWLKDVNSSLIWLIMVWDIPLPVVNQDWYIFPTVYPYVDFEEQKYVWDSEIEYFVPNDNPMWQAEIWHWLINYWDDIQAYLDFFIKVRNYAKDPEWFIWDSMWYDDFISQKKWFLNENFPYYRNRIMFAEDLWYQRYSPLMKKMFRGEQTENALDIVSDLEDATDLDFSWKDVLLEMNAQWLWDMHSTQMVQQEIQTSFISDYNDLFSKINTSTMRENVFAWWRWIKEYQNSDWEKSMVVDSDSSAAKLQLKDDILLWNENLQWLIENLNDLMEDMIDKKIEDEKYSMDIVVPVSYQKTTWKRVLFKRYYFVDRYENYYFGNNARLIDDAEDLSIYRWTYRNLSDLSGVSYSSLLQGNNPIKWQYDKTDLKLKSIWWSYDIFSNQVEWNRWYTMLSVENDLNIYDENKTEKNAKKKKSWFLGRVRKKTRPEACPNDGDTECELLYDFAQRWRWWASPINLDTDSISNWIYTLSGYKATDSWRPIFDMWWFQSLKVGNDEWINGTWWINWFWAWPQWAANSFKAYIKYASPTQREWWRKYRQFLTKYEYYENHTPDVHRPFSDLDYFRLDENIIKGWSISKDRSSDKIFNIFRPRSWRTMEQYSYKVISSVVKHKSTTDEQINWIDRNRYGENWTLSMYYNDVKSAYENLQYSVSEILDTLSGLVVDINSGSAYINAKLSELEDTGLSYTGINPILDDIDSFVDEEHENLSGFYNSLQWLYVENIISVIDSIIYMEWWSRSWNIVDMKKIWFLPIWLSEISGVEKNITWSIWLINSYYAEVRSWIIVQQKVWSGIYWDLVNKEWIESWKVEVISGKINNIFWIENIEESTGDLMNDPDPIANEDRDEDGSGWGETWETTSGVMLTWWTAEILMDAFNEELKQVDIIFSNVFEIDTIGPQIELAAKKDDDFEKWMKKNWINYKLFTSSDWINQYAQWVKWPWYDSEWARKNHDLLDGISEHITWMNILTPDRPIDSPRYVSMQSIAWNEIKFIYPDLFKVEVYSVKEKNKSGYDVHELLTWGQIKANLIKYLSWKVYEYNRILQNECNNAKQMNLYFETLSELGYEWATPDKWEHGCNKRFTFEDFVDVLWWEKMLDVISETLYYQSLTNTKKLSAWNVSEDINLIKQSFSLNDKRGQVLKDYLTEWNEKTRNPIFEIPTYEIDGYEVAFINSDGKDYIFSQDESENGLGNVDTDVLNSSNKGNRQPSSQEKELEDECNIPPSWKLPLFKLNGTSPWLVWFKCWLKKIREEPIKLKLKFDSSLWEILSSDSFEEYVKNSDLGETFSEWWKSWDNYLDSWDSLVNTSDSYDSDAKITQMQVNAEKYNQEAILWDTWLSNALSKLYKNLKISNDNVLLSDSNPTGELRIESMVDLWWNITVEFIWTWDGCIQIDSNSLCNGKTYQKVFNPKTDPFVGVVSSSDHIAWKVALIMNIKLWWWYIKKVIKYTVSPSVLDHVDIKLDDNKTVAWMMTPIEVIWYDKYENKVSWWLQKYDFELSQWRFFKDWAYQTGFSTNDFRNLKFYYQAPLDAPDWSVVTFQIKPSKTSGNVVLWTRNWMIVQANPVIKVNWNTVLSWSEKLVGTVPYKLSDDEDVYSWWKLNVSKLQKFDIEIRDSKWNLVDVDSQVLVTSKNWLLVLWNIIKQENWEFVFSKTSKGYIRSGHVIIYFYPTTVAGDDIVDIDIPWLDTRVVNFSIKPSDSKVVKLNVVDEYVEMGDVTYLEVFASDVRWNSTDMELKIQSDPRYVDLIWISKIYSGQDKIISSVNIKNGYLKIPLRWVWAWYTDISVWVGETNALRVLNDVEFSVNDDLLPKTWLNIMYLNYFWNDWWNQWWYLSKNNKHVESLMKKSNKIITTTTLLAIEDKIKKVVWKVEPWFKITNFDGVNTKMMMKSWKLNIFVWWLSEMDVTIPSFDWVTATFTSVDSLLSDSTSSNKDYIFFIPSDPNYSIKWWILYNSDEAIANVMDWKLSLQLDNQILDNWDNVWNVIDKWVNYWKMIIHFPNLSPSVKDFKDIDSRYMVDKLFTRWSTDIMSSVWLFDMISEFELNTSYKSIQNSDEIDEKIWFLGDFKNITLFAEWEIVGDATKTYWSELLINLWDPVLSRKDVNEKVYGTDYDWWIWQEIYSDPEKDIFWTYQIDFNNDWLKDWLIVYLDGWFKLAKNYWWKPDLRNMQDLMRIAVRVKDVFVWDADWNKYEDIFVLTDNNQIRVYLNNWWKFDVDWNVVCLNQNVLEWEISETPSDLKWLNQFFVEDMNLDEISDIITYDEKWYVKVFYWWSTKQGSNYLSKEKYACDSWWYDREIGNTTIVTALWLHLSSGDVYDNSMMYWVGLSKSELQITESEISDYWVNFNPSSLSGFVKVKDRKSAGSIKRVMEEVMSKDSFDVSVASSKFIDEESKYVDVTLYENTLVWWSWKNYTFVPISYLDSNNPKDKCIVWKNYKVKSWRNILMDGDIVTVSVTVKASDSSQCIWAYWDIIQWPWTIYYDDSNIMKWIKFLQNKRNAVVKSKDWSFSYIIDNIKLSPWEKMEFEYDLEYHPLPLKKMSITYDTFWSNDKWPDIKLQYVDWCWKDFDWFINLWKNRSFQNKKVPLQNYIDKEYEDEDNMTNDYSEDVIKNWSNVNQLPGMVKDNINRVKLLQKTAIEISDDEDGKQNLKSELLRRIQEWWLEALNLNISLSILEWQLDNIESIVDDLTKWMCNWFSFGWSNNCKWLPVPFNQAFLAPGKYHLFGCWQLPMGPLEWWLPTFFFPGTLNTPFWPIMFPWWLKSPKDGFLWVGGWVYPSFIRIYAAPTLTAQLWIAICMWPYMDEFIFPSPLSDVAGNCVVFAVKPQCKGGGSEKKKDKDNPNEIFDPFVEDVRDSWVCLQSQKWLQVTKKWHRSSPFDLYSYSSNIQDGSDGKWTMGIISWGNMNVDWWENNQLEFDWSFLWIINLETSAYIWGDTDTPNENNSLFIWDVDVLGWDFSINKIRWWIQQWIRKILIDKWLDPQIRYIVNQLTKMHINIKLPDVSNLIGNEVQTIKNVKDNFKSIWKFDKSWYSKVETWIASKLWGFSYINTDNLQNFNKAISNPFEALASLMNESNIINITVEPITVKVPMIFPENINEYSIYLQQWLEVNEKILYDWASVLSKSEFELALKNRERLQNQIYVNLMTLQKYRNFPFEIYEWIHVIDRYMAEIASLINNTIWYLAYWTSTNSQRFVWYVDAIVLILNIIKTYQLLINFSVEWWQNCGNCTKDTYDQYSCKLSLLCDMIQLPIIQIPNFKLPNITLDLSDIDLGLDIILPKFNFQTVKVNLPELPNLPEAPSLSLGIKLNLPDIPMLPEPPELPELPSFIPEIELELPILPPAPELPKLPNEIEAIIKVAKLIWKIYCIVKWKFWLVWESSVKAKIEQLTQRTYEVKWIDTLMDFTNRSVAPVHNYGLDYEISSELDLQFDFSFFYDYLDTLTKSINNLSTSAANWVNSKVDTIVNDNPVVWAMEEINGVNVGVNVELWMADTSVINWNTDWLLSDEIEYVDYDSAKSRLEDVLVYFNKEMKDTTMWDTIQSSITNIKNQINKENRVESNVQGLEKLQKDVIAYLDEQRSGYNELATLINTDYEGFLAMIDSQNSNKNSKSESKTGELLTFNVELFSVDSSTKDVIQNITKANPYESIISNKKDVIDWYWNAINSNTANDLWLSERQYLVLRNNISSMKDQVTTLYSVMRPVSSTELLAKSSRINTNKTLVSATESARLWSNIEVADAIDPSVLSEWIYAKINKWADSWKLTKVVYSDSFASDIWKKYYHTDHFRGGHIVLFNDGWVYLKCSEGICSRAWWEEKWNYYVSKTVVEEIPYEEMWLNFGNNLKLKIADLNTEVKKWEVMWQNYDSLQLSRNADQRIDGYLIKLVERIDNSYEKVDYKTVTPVKYVLALPEGTDVNELYSSGVKLELLKKTGKIGDLLIDDEDKFEDLRWDNLVQIVYYSNYKDEVSIMISNIDRKWYYARIATLDLDNNTYKISSPWSNQVVAWRQIVWDDLAPEWNPILYRPSVKEIVSQWDNLEWYVGTKYNLIVNWKDNVSLSYINLSKNWKILDEKYTSNVSDIVSTNIDIHTQDGYDTFSSVWIDQFGNKTQKQIMINYSIPEISITNISKNSDWESVSIEAELSQDIDQWNVSFQRNRGSKWKTLKTDGDGSSDILLSLKQKLVVWSPYSIWNGIAMYGKNWEVIASLDPDTAEIKIQTGYEDKYEVGVVVQNGLILQLRDKKSEESVFSISVPIEDCSIKEAENYNVVALPKTWKMGMFNWWKAVYKDWNNVLFLSPTCHFYSELWLEWTYVYDREQNSSLITLYQLSDLEKNSPIKVLFKVKPYFEN